MQFLPQFHKVKLYKNGLIYKETFDLPSHKVSRRDVQTGFSIASRRRLVRVLTSHSVSDSFHPYSASFSCRENIGRDRWGVIMGRLRKHVSRRGDCAIWRVELQKRGAVHLHLLLYSAETDPDVLQEDYRDIWLKILGLSKDDPEFDYGVRISCYESAGWLNYIGCHHIKASQHLHAWQGRQWGYFGRKHFSHDALCVCSLTPVQASYFVRLSARWLRRLGRRSPVDLSGFCALGLDDTSMRRLLRSALRIS